MAKHLKSYYSGTKSMLSNWWYSRMQIRLCRAWKSMPMRTEKGTQQMRLRTRPSSKKKIGTKAEKKPGNEPFILAWLPPATLWDANPFLMPLMAAENNARAQLYTNKLFVSKYFGILENCSAMDRIAPRSQTQQEWTDPGFLHPKTSNRRGD